MSDSTRERLLQFSLCHAIRDAHGNCESAAVTVENCLVLSHGDVTFFVRKLRWAFIRARARIFTSLPHRQLRANHVELAPVVHSVFDILIFFRCL